MTAEVIPDKVDLWDHRSLMDRQEACIWGQQIYNIKYFDLASVSSAVSAIPDTGVVALVLLLSGLCIDVPI